MRSAIRGTYSSGTEQVVGVKRVGQSANYFGKFPINPDAWILVDGKAERLTKVLGLTPNVAGNYFLSVAGVGSDPNDIHWSGTHFLAEINANSGAHRAAENSLLWQRVERAFGKSAIRITNAKMELNLLSAAGELQKVLDSNYGTDTYQIKARVGNHMNLVDPFSPIDERIGKGRELGSNIEDFSKFNVYADIVHQGRSQTYVGNTFLSYYRIQDVDSDTLSIMELNIFKDDKLIGSKIFDKKFPHTTHQRGSLSSIGQRDIEGELYDPFKKFRRMTGAFDPKGAHGGVEGLNKIISQTRELAEANSIDTYRSRTKLAQMIQKSITDDVVGIITSKQWLQESLDIEHILNYIPEYLAENHKLGKDEQKKLIEYLQQPGVKSALSNHLNPGFKGPRRTVTENILKRVNRLEDMEAMSLNAAYDIQSRILMFRNKSDSFTYEDQLLLAHEWSGSDPIQRMKLVTGLISPTFVRTKSFPDRLKAKKIVSPISKGKVLLSNGKSVDPLIESLTQNKIFNPKTGNYEALLDIQAIDLQQTLGPEYLKHLSPEQREKATKGYLLSMKGFDSEGNIIRSPLSGTHPTLSSESEKSWFLPPQYDPGSKRFLDPLEELASKVERAKNTELEAYSFLRQYGLGELQGVFSIDSLKKVQNLKYVKQLADANPGISVERIQSLVKKGDAESIKYLKAYKTALDLQHRGNISTSVFMDAKRVIEMSIGGMGSEVTTLRDSAGRMFFKDHTSYMRAAEQLIVNTGMEKLSAQAFADYIAGGAMLGDEPVFIGAIKQQTQREADKSLGLTTRARTVNGRVTSYFTDPDVIYEAKRISKGSKPAMSNIRAGEFRVASVSINILQEAKDRLEGIAGSLEAKKLFGAEHFDEGLTYLTESGQKKVEKAIFQNFEIGDYSDILKGDYLHELHIWDGVGKRKVYTKKPMDLNRLITNRLGSHRIVPWSGQLGGVMSEGKEVDLLVTVGEQLSKGGGAEMMRQKIATMSEDIQLAWQLAIASGPGSKAVQEFHDKYIDKLGSEVSFQLLTPEGMENHSFGGAILNTMDIEIRNSDADQQLHTFSSYGTFNKKLKQFMAPVPNEDRVEALEFKLSGRSAHDTIPEFAQGISSWIQSEIAQGKLPEGEITPAIQGLDAINMTNILLTGWEKHTNPIRRGLGSSIAGQQQLSREEAAIVSLARNTFRNYVALEHKGNADFDSETLIKLGASSAGLATREAFMSGFTKALQEHGIENLEKVLRSFF